MAFNVPGPLLPRNLVSCTVYGGNVVTAPTVTWSTGVDIGSKVGTAVYAGFSINARAITADVTPTDATIKVNVASQVDVSFTISEIAAADGSSALSAIATGYDYLKVVALYRPKGASSGGTYRAVIGLIAEADESLDNPTGTNPVKIDCISGGVTWFEGATLPAAFS